MSEATYKRCRDCFGKGTIMGGGMIAPRDCDECKGSGRIMINDDRYNDDDTECIELQPKRRGRPKRSEKEY